MKKIGSLNELYSQYSRGDLPKKEFEGCIFQYILDYYQRFPRFAENREQRIDYLCGLYPHISRAIDAYQDMGATFEKYLFSKVYWTAREFRFKEADHKVTEYACWKARAEDAALCEQEPEYLEALPLGKPISNPRQVLLLSLKSYFYMSDDLISRIAPAIGISKETLSRWVDELRKLRLQRDQEIQEFQERLHGQYYRILAFAQKLAGAEQGSARSEKLKDRLERAKKRYAAMKKRYAAINRGASNRQIAEVLGVPKGTVDSNLYAVKQKIKILRNEE